MRAHAEIIAFADDQLDIFHVEHARKIVGKQAEYRIDAITRVVRLHIAYHLAESEVVAFNKIFDEQRGVSGRDVGAIHFKIEQQRIDRVGLETHPFHAEAKSVGLGNDIRHEVVALGIGDFRGAKNHPLDDTDIRGNREIEMSRLHLGLQHANMVRLKHQPMLEPHYRIRRRPRVVIKGILHLITSLVSQILESQQPFTAQHAQMLIRIIERKASVVSATDEAVDLETLHHVHHRERFVANGQQHLTFGIEAVHLSHIIVFLIARGKKQRQQGQHHNQLIVSHIVILYTNLPFRIILATLLAP